MRRVVGIISTFVLVFGCREPFDFNFEEVEAPRVVIDGFISDRDTLHAIQVSYSTSINEQGLIETNFVTNAHVRIEDDQGNFTLLHHFEAGIYHTAPQYRAQEGRIYTLVVTLPNGEVYQSSPRFLPPASPAIAQLSFQSDVRKTLVNNALLDQEGTQVNATIITDDQKHFYQWLIGYYYIHEADLAPEDFQFCYIRDFDESRVELLQAAPAATGGDMSFEYELDFIPVAPRTEHDFGVEGRLLTMHPEDYDFWERVKSLSENTGGLFDAAPFSIEGNIFNRNSGERALGYFGVYRESMDRVFFSPSELDFGIRTYPTCLDIAPSCVDCRDKLSQVNFGVERPVWWRQ